MRNRRNKGSRALMMNIAPEVSIPLSSDQEQGLTRWLGVTALFMASLNLRPAIASIAPVLGSIQHDLGLSSAVSSFLVSIPMICMGLLAPFSVKLSGKLGNERVIALSLALIGGSTLLRLFIQSAALLFLTTVLTGIGIAMLGPLLSGFIKKHMADCVPSMIAVYSMALALGAALGSSLTSPLNLRLDSWQMALGFWCLPAILALPLWLSVQRRRNRGSVRQASSGKLLKLPWKTGKVWILTIQFGMLSLIFYSLLGWLPLMLTAAGASRVQAGFMVTLFAMVQIPSGIILQLLLSIHASRRDWLIVSSIMQATGLLLLFFSLYLWFAVLLCGLGAGMLFALVNLLPVEATSTPEEAASWAAMTQCFGFLIGAAGPFLIGYLYDRMGDFHVGIMGLVFISTVMGIISLFIIPQRNVLAVCENT